MIRREIAATWVAERAYYLWLNSGQEHGKDREHYETAEREWLKLVEKSWRSWNRDAQHRLIIDLSPRDQDIEKCVKDIVEFFFAHSINHEGSVHRIVIRNDLMLVWLEKAQPYPGHIHDWRICKLPSGWDRPVAKSRELVLSFQRYTV